MSEDVAPVGHETKEAAEREADAIGRDVVGHRARETEDVTRDSETAERDPEGDGAEGHVQRVLPGKPATWTVSVGPEPVADVGDGGPRDERDRLGDERLLTQPAVPAQVHERVVAPDVDGQAERAHCRES